MQLTNHARYTIKNDPFWAESLSGDSTVFIELGHLTLLAVIDGTGHGMDAHNVSKQMATYIEVCENWSQPSLIIEQIHQQLVPCIGAAIGIAVIDSKQQQITFSGVGNICAYIIGQEDYAFVSHDGCVGNNIRKTSNAERTLSAGDIILLHSDGIQSRLFTRYNQEYKQKTTNEFMTYIFQNFNNGHDDASCIIYRY